MEKKKSNQHHHPKKGDKIKVEPIRGIEDIKSIAKLLTDTPRDHFLFTMGITTVFVPATCSNSRSKMSAV